jgi:hypothetical protein
VDLWEATKILFRRWYITVPICALAVLGAFAAGSQMDPEYVASGVGILLPIDETGQQAIFGTPEEAENPWEAAGAVATMRSVALVLGADGVRSQIVDQGLAPTYSIEVEPRDPIVYVDVTDRDPDLALVTLDEMILRLEDELDSRQSQVQAPETRRFKIEILSQSEVPLPDYGNRTRVRIIVLLLGLVLAAAAGLVFDAWAVARAERRQDGDADESDTPEIGATVTAELDTVADADPIGKHVAADDLEEDFAADDSDERVFSTDEDETQRAPVTVGARRGQFDATAADRDADQAKSGRRTSGTSKRR